MIGAIGFLADAASFFDLNTTDTDTTTTTELASGASEVASGYETPLIDQNNFDPAVVFQTFDPNFPPGVFYFQSYMPEVTMNDDTSTTYPTGVVYMACAIVCLLTSLLWATFKLRTKFRRPKAAISASATLTPGRCVISPYLPFHQALLSSLVSHARAYVAPAVP